MKSSRQRTAHRRRLRILVLALTVGCGLSAVSSRASAQDLRDRFNIRLIVQGLYMAEQNSAIPAGYGREAQAASPFELGYGELRAIIDGRRLPGNFELHIDGRVRISGNFSTDAAQQGADQIVARGYLGGREYELRSTYVRRRGENVDFALGRLVVPEADALKIDGLRLWWRLAKHWDASVYAGLYPNPFSRSLTSDYAGGLAIAGGLDTTYTYDKIWGSVSVSSSYLSGNDDGGPLPATINDPASTAGVVGKVQTEAPRTWITWTDYVRLLSWLDIFTDVVLDVTGSAGVELTRLDAQANIRAGKHLTIRLGYDHLSSFAIEMWLTKLLASRVDHQAGTIENNLVVNRTARDQVYGNIDVTFDKLSLFGEGRFRKRAIVSLSDDPQFAVAGNQVAPGTAWDATLGIRDRGSLAGLRPALWGMYLADYRTKGFIMGMELGRSFADDRLSIDLSFLYSSTSDQGANNPMVGPCVGPPASIASVYNNCYGTRAGATYEAGLTITAAPSLHWFAFLDYRLVADTSGGYVVPPGGTMATLPQPTILTHVLLLRIEARY
ncbi:MAG: hypothetical protein JWN44_5760 [Myxococcales bacterium]|nr:hypothetical protein [Myxococcales bacterium]